MPRGLPFGDESEANRDTRGQRSGQLHVFLLHTVSRRPHGMDYKSCFALQGFGQCVVLSGHQWTIVLLVSLGDGVFVDRCLDCFILCVMYVHLTAACGTRFDVCLRV